MSRSALPAGIVLPAWKIVYVPVPKAACTSLLWTLADVQQERIDPAAVAASTAVTRALLVHEPAFWRHTPLLDRVATDDWDRLRRDDGWLVFTMTRHPVSRLWSAWQSKLLLREPRFVDVFSGCDWFPRVPRSPGDVVADFRRFVRALAEDAALLRADRHWRPQVELLAQDRIGYTHVGTTTAFAATLGVLERHLRERGWRGTLTSQRENATGLGAGELGAVDDEVRARIETLYADDMTALGYEPHDAGPAAAATATAGRVDRRAAQRLVDSAREIIARHERLGDVLAQRDAVTAPLP